MPEVYSRRKGAKPPPANAVYVGRGTQFGNPFVMGTHGDRDTVIWGYVFWLGQRLPSPSGQTPPGRRAVETLRGKDLVCYCAPEACHADILLYLANR